MVDRAAQNVSDQGARSSVTTNSRVRRPLQVRYRGTHAGDPQALHRAFYGR